MQRRDPFSGLEPVEDLGMLPAVLARRPGRRQTPLRPSERRRRARQISLTFSDPDLIDRLRDFAERRGMVAANGGPAISSVVEQLLRNALDAEDRGSE